MKKSKFQTLCSSNRFSFFQIGLIISLSFAVFALEFSGCQYKSHDAVSEYDETNMYDLEIAPPEREEKTLYNQMKTKNDLLLPASDVIGIYGLGDNAIADELAPDILPGADVKNPDQNYEYFNTEEYERIFENPFHTALNTPLSTFSIDVDNASYSNIRRMINYGEMPRPDAVRIEEMINYFNYDYPAPNDEHPFSINTELADCPWNENNQLLHIGLQGKNIDYENLQASNLVFLVDVSGSMQDANKLPLVKSSLNLLVDKLSAKDRVALVVYAGAAGLVLPSTPASEKAKIKKAIKKLKSGGSTAGGAGIKLAYKIAKENLFENGNNRVILATDGDFNVGVSSTGALTRMIEEKRDDGIFLTICGFGMGNYKDSRMESIADNGNGNYFYIDNIREAQKVFVEEMRATLFTIAKDVKIQIEFNPAKVESYRLIGYENRILNKEDFNDDKKDAGELGAGHSVTALYEIVPKGEESNANEVDPLKYQDTKIKKIAKVSNELLTIKLRYKKPKEDESLLITSSVTDKSLEFSETSDNFKFSSAVASFGMLLRASEYAGSASYLQAQEMAASAKGKDEHGYRDEFIKMVSSVGLMTKR